MSISKNEKSFTCLDHSPLFHQPAEIGLGGMAWLLVAYLILPILFLHLTHAQIYRRPPVQISVKRISLFCNVVFRTCLRKALNIACSIIFPTELEQIFEMKLKELNTPSYTFLGSLILSWVMTWPLTILEFMTSCTRKQAYTFYGPLQESSSVFYVYDFQSVLLTFCKE